MNTHENDMKMKMFVENLPVKALAVNAQERARAATEAKRVMILII
jgi:hypothetical protein